MAQEIEDLPENTEKVASTPHSQAYQNIPEPHELEPITQKELDDAIKNHTKYLRGQIGGTKAIIRYKNLSQLNMRAVDLSQADFLGSMFIESDMSNSILAGVNFFACDMRNANLTEADLSRADLRGAYLAGADLTRANLDEADMRQGKIMKKTKTGSIEDRKFSGSQGSVTVLAGAKLTECNMSRVNAGSADFTDADLTSVKMVQADVHDANFESANLTDGNLTGANLANAKFRSSIVSGTVMTRTNHRDADLGEARLERHMGEKLESLGRSLPELLEDHNVWIASKGEKGKQLDLSDYDLRDILDLKNFSLTAVHCIRGNFISQDLSGAELQSGTFDRSDFSDCNLTNADLRASTFKYAKFTRANLKGTLLCPLEFTNGDGSTRLQRVDLSGTNMRYANISDADLRHCIMMGVDLTSAVLRNCDLRHADLTGAILQGTILENVRLDDAIIDLKML